MNLQTRMTLKKQLHSSSLNNTVFLLAEKLIVFSTINHISKSHSKTVIHQVIKDFKACILSQISILIFIEFNQTN